MPEDEENPMSTPATVQATPEAYGERQQQPATGGSVGVMDNLSRAAQEDVAAARECLKAGYDAALSQLDMQYQMEKARLDSQYADLDGRLRTVEETIASYKVSAVKAMDSFLTECKSASLTAVELIPVTTKQRAEEYVERQDPPKFLDHNRDRQDGSVTPMRRPLVRSIIPAVILAAIVVLTAVGVGIAWSQERPLTQVVPPKAIYLMGGGVGDDGLTKMLRMDADGNVYARCVIP